MMRTMSPAAKPRVEETSIAVAVASVIVTVAVPEFEVTASFVASFVT